MTPPAITVGTRPTTDRTVVYWHHVEDEGSASDPVLKADHRGAFVHVDHKDAVPAEWIAHAEEVAAVLEANPTADMSHLVRPAP